MKLDPHPLNEEERLAALESYRILDTEPERAYDDITSIAAQICGAAIAMVSLVDRDRQWFKSKIGLEESETARDIAFCAHTILQPEVMVVPDALADERFRSSPLVLDGPKIRFYAGAPLVDNGGFNLGALCVVDREPREISAEQSLALQALARMVVDQLELRQAAFRLGEALDRVRLLDGLVPVCCYCRKVRDDSEYWQDVETFLREHSGTDFTHGVCPDCLEIELAKAES